jgi:hypothetical protein
MPVSRNTPFRGGRLAALAVAALALSPLAVAADGAPAGKAAEHVVLQISEGDAFKQKLLLNNVANLLEHGEPDQVEVVAYGPGLRLFARDNPRSQRIQALMDRGVTFTACATTMRVMDKELADLVAGARKVPSGVAHLVQR